MLLKLGAAKQAAGRAWALVDIGVPAPGAGSSPGSRRRASRRLTRPCFKARKGEVLVVWKLDRLGRNLAHLVLVQDDQPVMVAVSAVYKSSLERSRQGVGEHDEGGAELAALGLVHRQAVGQLERVAAFVWNASGQPPWASTTSSISAMM